MIGVWRALFEQETVVPIWCIDHMKLDVLSCFSKRLGELLRILRRIKPIRAEGDQ